MLRIVLLGCCGWVCWTAHGVAQDVANHDLPDQQVAEQELAELKSELKRAGRDWVKEYRAAKTDAQRAELDKRGPYRVFEKRFLQFAREHVGSPAALDAVQWLAQNAVAGPVLDQGLELARQHHLNDPGITRLCRMLSSRQSPGIESLLLAVAQEHSSRDVQALANLCLARYFKNFHDFAVRLTDDKQAWIHQVRPFFSADTIDWLCDADPDELAARVDEYCEIVRAEFADVNDDQYREATGESQSLLAAIGALHFSLHAVGSMAPEFNGKDSNGMPVNWKDYRGKVVVLMFSASWCGPCRKLYGQLRELTGLYADEPFSVITVMADRDVQSVAKAVESREITWPAIWDGDKGPIARDWYITKYPTIYVIDRDGRIRSEGLRDDSLDDQVAELLGISLASRVRLDKRTRVWELSLRNRGVRGPEIPKLIDGYTKLRKLDLSHNPLDDKALAQLVPLKKLERIDIGHRATVRSSDSRLHDDTAGRKQRRCGGHVGIKIGEYHHFQ